VSVRGDVGDGPQHRVDLQNPRLPSLGLQHGLSRLDHGGKEMKFSYKSLQPSTPKSTFFCSTDP
jgi:hypothetical protein